jgi:hypothetical protein
VQTPHRIITFVAGLALVVAAGLAPAGPAAAAVPLEGLVQASSLASGLCLEIEPSEDGNFHINGLRVWQKQCVNSRPQNNWVVKSGFGEVDNSPVVHLVNRASQMCLDVRDGSRSDRGIIQQWSCNPTSSTMKWVIVDLRFNGFLDDFQIFNLRSQKCLDIPGASLQEFTYVQQYRCTEGNYAQRFVLPRVDP